MSNIVIPPRPTAPQPNVPTPPTVPLPSSPQAMSASFQGPAGPTQLAGLSDVYIPPMTPIDGYVLTYNNQRGKWMPLPLPTTRTVYISVSITGLMNPSEVLMQYAIPEAITIASVAAQGHVTVTINKNNQQVGTIWWGPGSYSGTINLPSKLYLVAGDVLQLLAPASTDPSLANIGVTFACVRGG